MEELLSDNSYGIDFLSYFDGANHFCEKHQTLICSANSILSPYSRTPALLCNDRPHLCAYSAILRHALLATDHMDEYINAIDNCATIDQVCSFGEALISKCTLLPEKKQVLTSFESLNDVKEFIKNEAANFSAKNLKFKKFIKPVCKAYCEASLIQSALLRTGTLKLIFADHFDPLCILDAKQHIYADCSKTCLLTPKKGSWSYLLNEEREKLNKNFET